MNRRLSLATVAIATLVLVAGCSAPLQTTAGNDTPGAEPRTISTSGSGTVSADADLAVVTVAVTARADTANAAREDVAASVEEMRDALREAGVADDAVTTDSYRIRPVSDPVRESGEREITGYEAVHTYRIETTPDNAGSVVDTAIENGGSEVYGVSFTLSDERRAELRERAIERAMDAARTDADTIAAAADLSVTGVQSASTSGGHSPIYETRATAADSGGVPTQFDAGSVTVSATVDVTYTAAE
ncbi:SIMPL domain-containing protein [Halobellus captivus]|uniref:SIMPL domain-containing protein n=1 Tax=Halobellus captivus TaxID=2592614 RepID=UPI00119EEEFB|nr:SIMPL domain-containing protein [Halobellus captivus]